MFNRKHTAALLLAAVTASQAYAEVITLPALPDPTIGINAAQYGDFYSYSLPLLAYRHDLAFGGGVGPGNPFYIDSSAGQIKDYIVVATGSSGGPVNTNFAGMDNAYATPSGVGGNPAFYTNTGDSSGYGVADPDQVAAFAGDSENSWDARVSSIMDFLGGEELVVFFNNNQINSCEDHSCQELFAAAQIRLVSDDGLSEVYFDLLNNGGLGPIFGFMGGDTGNYTSAGPWGDDFDDYVRSGGQVCVNADASMFVDCDAPGAELFNHNLGANQAAYAIWSPELMAALRSGLYDVMQVDIRMRDLNNGYEQIFIGRMASTPPHEVPAPAALLIMAIGLLGLWRSRRL